MRDDDPFARALPHPRVPRRMREAPVLSCDAGAGPVRRRYALLLNPFYAKDPNASFGDHALTPTRALTSFAAATAAHWEVDYWDENLLGRAPAFDRLPERV